MKVTLTREQMLSEWLRRRAVEPLRLDCTAVRADGPDVAAIASGEMRAWYLHQLDNAPVHLLVPSVIMGADVQMAVDSTQRLASVRLPQGVRRVLWLEFSDAAPVVPHSTLWQVGRAATNPLWHRPLAAVTSGGTVVVGACPGPLVKLCAVVDPGPEIYEFDDALWNEMTY